MNNPLIAERKDSTTAFSGVPILESVQDTSKAIESGDWAAGVMGGVGTALDALSMAMDPFGSIFAAGVGWLIEHVGPVSDALDALTGDADEISAHAETWKNIHGELADITAELARIVDADTAGWTGEAGDAYRKRAGDTGTLLEAAGKAAEGASNAMSTAGEIVGAVRTLVRDIIAELVGHLISWALQVVATLGIAMAWVVPQVVAEVSKVAARIGKHTSNLVQAFQKLTPLLKKLDGSFGDTGKALKNIKSDKPGPAPTNSAGSKGGLNDPMKDRPKSEEPSPPPRDSGSNDGPASTDTAGAKPGGDGPGSSPGSQDGPRNQPDKHDDGPASTNTSGANSRDGGGGNSRSENKPGSPRDRSVKAKDLCTGGTEPVDLATGHVVMTETDLEILGPLSLVFERMHISSYRAGRWFGRTWTSTVDQRLEVDTENVCYFSPDGLILVYPVPLVGQTVLPVEGPRWPLEALPSGEHRIVTDDRTLTFAVPRPGGVCPLRMLEGAERSIEVEIDDSGAPRALRHSDGYQVAIDTARGRVTAIRVVDSVQGLDVPVLRYGYDAAGLLSEVTNSSGIPLRFDYDEAGRLTGWQDRNGSWFRYVYDESGRCVRTVGPEGYFDATLRYDGLTTTHVDSLGAAHVYEFNEAHQLLREVDPLGAVTTSTWDRYDRLLSRTDPLGRTTTHTYDEDGELAAITRPDGSVVESVMENGRLAAIAVDDGERTWTRAYAPSESPDPVGGQVGVAPEFSLDDLTAGRSGTGVGEDEDDEVDSAAGPRDLFGRPIETATANGGRVQHGWTVEGERAWQVNALGAREQWRYDPENNEIAHIDEVGSVTAVEYGPFEVVLAEVDATGARTTYRYDTERKMTSVTNPLGQTWHYVYDAAGRITGETDFDGRRKQYAHDAAGQLLWSSNALGEVTEYRYDQLGNLVEARSPSDVTTYTHSPVGRLLRAVNAEATVEFSWDDQGRVTSETVNGRAVTFAFDDRNQVMRRRTPGGIESVWTSDVDGRASRLDFGGHVLRWEHDAAGNVVARDIDGTTAVVQTFDLDNRLSSRTLTNDAGARVGQQRFHHRADGTLVGVDDETRGETRYQLDANGRVVEVAAADHRESYRYDAAGNISAATTAVGPEDGARQYAGTQLVSCGELRYQYDPQGRVVHIAHPTAQWQCSWDSHDRLVAVTTPAGQRWQYRYDPLGRRIAKQRLVPDQAGTGVLVAEQVDFTWDGGRIIEQLRTDPAGNRELTTWEHLPDDDHPVAQLISDAVGARFTAMVTDEAGMPTEVLDSHGNPLRQERPTLWGKMVFHGSAPGATPLRFQGQYADAETGLYYNVYRYYDPATGRYLSQDPLGLAPSTLPMSYVDNPVHEVDPLGLARVRAGGTGRKHKPKSSGRHKIPGNKGKNPGNLPQRNKNLRKNDKVRPERWGGGNSSGKNTFGSDSNLAGGSKPDKLHCTDVSALERANKAGANSKMLNDELRHAGINPKAKNTWIRGHLLNENLGGPGVSHNMTPLTNKANNAMKGGVEKPCCDALDTFRHADKNGAPGLKLDYHVQASDKPKFPFDQPGRQHERSIREHLEMNIQYRGLTGDTMDRMKELQAQGRVTLPDIPPKGTRMDPISGAFTKPDGSPWVRNPRGYDLNSHVEPPSP